MTIGNGIAYAAAIWGAVALLGLIGLGVAATCIVRHMLQADADAFVAERRESIGRGARRSARRVRL